MEFETKHHLFEELTVIKRDSSRRGAEKEVVKVKHFGKIFAAKMYFETDSEGILIDKEARSREEFSAYLKLVDTPLGLYIPKPHCLLNDTEGNTIGLAVEWREGTSLSFIYPSQPIEKIDVDELEIAFLNSSVGELFPNDDMYSEANVMIGNETEKPKIWIAECLLSAVNVDYYRSSIKQNMDYLRSEYVKK